MDQVKRSAVLRPALLVASVFFFGARPAQAEPVKLLQPDGYFLSANNPLMTADQRDLEALAMRIVGTPALAKAKEQARQRWMILAGDAATPEAMARFDRFLDGYVFHYTLKAINSDPNYPRIVRVNMLPHRWFGRDVPGSQQGGGDNPDNVYSIIPIDYGARYSLSVRKFEPSAADVTYSLMGNLTPTMTLGSLEGRNIVAGKDGSYTISLDPEPAGDRPNHIQTQPDSRYLFIRESRSDWREKPAAITIRRLDPPTRGPLSEDQLVARAARYVLDDIPALYYWMAVMQAYPVNQMSRPLATGSLGGLVSQRVSFGRVKLADDDAIVVKVGRGGAAYTNLVLQDHWFDALDYSTRTSSLTNKQAVASADGTTTYVISKNDPGVYNWLDPQGLSQLLVVHRWQGLPDNPENGGTTSITTQLVKLKDLPKALPPDMRMVSARERERQRQERAAAYALRFSD